MSEDRDYQERPITMIENMARAIAAANGDDIDAIPLNKSDWVKHRGAFGGRFRDVNEPYRCDYWEMATKAVFSMKVPTDRMLSVGDSYLPQFAPDEKADSIEVLQRVWEEMLSEAMREFSCHGPYQ